jgi:hypothetical protein
MGNTAYIRCCFEKILCIFGVIVVFAIMALLYFDLQRSSEQDRVKTEMTKQCTNNSDYRYGDTVIVNHPFYGNGIEVEIKDRKCFWGYTKPTYTVSYTTVNNANLLLTVDFDIECKDIIRKE